MTGVPDIYTLFQKHPSISTDSRNVIPGSLFFAIKGDVFDGNRFAAEAVNKGAAFAIIDDPAFMAGKRYILVPDVLGALQQLAAIHRSHIHAKIIGITGSNGKTTTKELIGRVLGSAFKTVITKGNLNNHIGVPLTILSISRDTSFAVVEMGANHPGEIAGLCKIAQPDFGIITNIGKAHLEGFGSYEGVIKAKSELYDFIRQNGGLVFVNRDSQLLGRLSEGLKMFGYGSGDHADCKGAIVSRDPYLEISWSASGQNGIIRTQLYGDYNFENVLAAVSIGIYFKVDPDLISRSVSSYVPDNNRSQWINTGKNTLILDAYNANPSSMKAALLNFHEMNSSSKMIVLGDMMELGETSASEHFDIVSYARDLDFEGIFLIGDQFCKASSGGKEICFANIGQAEKWFQNNPVSNKTILLKGSRKMQLEKLRNYF